jgi:triacylglycerol lipase
MSFLVELPLHVYADHVFDDFTPDRDFRVGTARAMMWTAQLAYEVRDAQDKIEPVLKRWGLAPVALIGNGMRRSPPFASTRGLIAEGRGATIVAFAGTDPAAFANWITNFNLGERAREIHRGFDGAIHVVWKDVCKVLTARDPARPLFIAGHSLGGALAFIAAERLQRECGIKATGVYTFGAPRVGSSAFVRAYNAGGLGEHTYRLVHGLDIVPSLPPSQLGFRHVGRMIACKRGRRLTGTEAPSACDSDDPPFFGTISRGVQQRWRDLATGNFLPSSREGWLGHYHKYVLPPPFTDHLPERYRRAVETIVP